jgi:hypothetical protein
LLFGRRNKLQVDLGDLEDERQRLTDFLQAKLKTEIEAGKKLSINSETLSPEELEHVVNKFVYHRNHNVTHYVAVDGGTVRIMRFKPAKKPDKDKKKDQKKKKVSGTQNIAQGWGL